MGAKGLNIVFLAARAFLKLDDWVEPLDTNTSSAKRFLILAGANGDNDERWLDVVLISLSERNKISDLLDIDAELPVLEVYILTVYFLLLANSSMV